MDFGSTFARKAGYNGDIEEHITAAVSPEELK
jgi:hypothetical protein